MGPALDEAVDHMKLAAEAVDASDVDTGIAHLSAAIQGFTEGGDHRRAALACVQLGNLFDIVLGNLTAARAWYLRARRLVENEPPCVEQGWVAVAGLGCDVDDPVVLLERAELALDRARQFGDVNLETKALADGGLAHVQAGRVKEGMALLEEAMALACGPADDGEAAGKSICSFLTACYFTADFDRAASWTETFRRQRLIGDEAGGPVILGSHCDAVHATALVELGRWGEAEAILERSSQGFEARMQQPSWHPAIALAELRIRQGRLAEAESLLLGKDGHIQALLPAACLHLARGDHELAHATAVRGLRAIGDDRLRATELLAVLVDAELAAGDVERARKACEDLMARAEGIEVPALRARTAAAEARVLEASGDPGAAIGVIEAALDGLAPGAVPLHRGSLLLYLARLHDQLGNRAAAQVEARRARGVLQGLDVVLSSGDRRLLDRFAPLAAELAARRSLRTAELSRDGNRWAVEFDGVRGFVGDTKGLRYLAELVGNAGTERHALDLVDRVEGTAAEAGIDRSRIGHSGEMLDAQARRAYRRRVEELRAEIDEALSAGVETRAEKLQAELDQIVAELSRAFGLGGRARSAGSAAERARINVTRALRAATSKLTEVLPEAGTVLDRRLRTGLYCAYEPDPSDDVRWIVQSAMNGAGTS